MRKFFSRHLEIIKERINVHLKSSRIINQNLCLKNEHFLLKKLVFHKNLYSFFDIFPSTNYENTLFVNDTPYKSLFNPPFIAIFLETFYEPQINNDYLLKIVLLLLGSLVFLWYVGL
jgi:hypothetical protein